MAVGKLLKESLVSPSKLLIILSLLEISLECFDFLWCFQSVLTYEFKKLYQLKRLHFVKSLHFRMWHWPYMCLLDVTCFHIKLIIIKSCVHAFVMWVDLIMNSSNLANTLQFVLCWAIMNMDGYKVALYNWTAH